MIEQNVNSSIVFKAKEISTEAKDILKIIQHTNMKLTSGSWKRFSMPEVCKEIRQIKITGELALYGNREPEILRSLQDISFPFLTSLNIWGNKIQSIQELSRIYMPFLKSLRIWENDIGALASLRKCHWPHLQILNAKVNRIPEITRWSEVQTSKLTRIDVEGQIEYAEHLSLNARFIYKLEAPNLKWLYVKVKNMSISQKLLKAKFLLVQFNLI